MTSHFLNHRRLEKQSEEAAAPCVQHLKNWTGAAQEISSWPEYQPQPLRVLPATAQAMGIAKLLYKDESRRHGLDLASYKALGAPYAVYRILSNEIFKREGIRPTSSELRSGKYRHITQQVILCVSTDGNQGRALAYGARTFGCTCLVYIHKEVTLARAQKMRDLGAVVVRVDGDHQLSIVRAKEDARMNDWYFVSSVSSDCFDDAISQNIMNAYMILVEEVINTHQDMQEITHVFVCGGMGSISATIFLGLYLHIQDLQLRNGGKKTPMPRFIVVEPTEADGLLESAKEGSPQRSKGNLHTLMAGLACRSVSPAALKLLLWLASDFVAVPDSVAVSGMKALADAQGLKDVPIVCGESSAATMGVLIETTKDPALRTRLGLNANSQVMLFGLEGATDPEMYQRLVGSSRERVFQAQEQYLSQYC